MRAKFTVVLLLFVCLSVFGAQTTPVTVNQQESVSQLQAENEAMKKQLENLEKEVELYRGDIREEISRTNTNMALWASLVISFVALITGGLGIVIPIYNNHRNDKQIKEQVGIATEKAEKAEMVSEQMMKEVKEIQEKINKDTAAAEKAAKEAKASQLFAEASNETDASKAIELYSQAIKINPAYYKAYNNRGILKMNNENEKGAMEDYNKAIELNPNYANAYYNRAILKSKGDRKGAMDDYDKAIELCPNYAKAYYNRAILKNKKGDRKGAIDDYNKAIALEPNYAKAYNNRADLLRITGKLENAMADINIAIEKDNTDFVAYITRGEIYMDMGKYDEAIPDFDQALAINGSSKSALDHRAECLKKLEEREQSQLDEQKEDERDS